MVCVAMTKKRSRRPQPLAPPPQSSTLRSRKRARQVTTLFHKYSQERDAALARAELAAGCPEDGADADDPSSLVGLREEVKKWDDKLSEIGGREEYQRASQMNTSLFSTSKWVLGVLGRWGWLDGMKDNEHGLGDEDKSNMSDIHRKNKDKRGQLHRRDVRLLEVGAINTQLIDAAARTRMRTDPPNKYRKDNSEEAKICDSHEHHMQPNKTERVHHLDVKAIDLRSTDPRIQQMDFFDLPPPESDSLYDVIVNSMVINCVTTPDQRGRMLSLCYRHLRPGGVCFLTLPKLCLIQSKFMSRSYFEEILTRGVGFEIVHEVGRESPKIVFFVLRRPNEEVDGLLRSCDEKFTRMPVLHSGKMFRNTFAVTLN
jgi:25S rRNA (adenine2142-N1)-methyltransferase